MPLADAFCVVNRARGLELLSPEDFVAAARLMAGLNLPVVLKVSHFRSQHREKSPNL